jgi:transcriptional regulator with XRE-family HTH domain
MARALRQRPTHLAVKLRQIRDALDLSQNGLIRQLDLVDQIYQDYISAYERGIREPPLPILLRYARLAGVCVDVLIDDEIKLPAKLPGTPKHRGRGSRSNLK